MPLDYAAMLDVKELTCSPCKMWGACNAVNSLKSKDDNYFID